MSSGVLGDHQQRGGRFIPPLMSLGVELIDWEGIHLPEHLWLAAIVKDSTVSEAAALYNAAAEIIDDYFEAANQEVFVGLMSDFARVPVSAREATVDTLASSTLAAAAVSNEFRSMLSLYPVGPAAWLAKDDGADSLGLARDLVALLRDQKVGKAAQCRVLGLNRLLKHDRIVFSSDVVDETMAAALESYPHTNEEDTARVEQFVRIAMNMDFHFRPRTGWPLAFWQRNLELAVCQ